jgi:hypothetical protein
VKGSHGIDLLARGDIRLRVFGAERSQVAALARWAPATVCRHEQEPDLRLRVIPATTRRRPLEIGFENIGRGCDLLCQQRIPSRALLRPLLHALAASRGWLVLHAAGFVDRGGTLIVGAPGAGKTTSLLGLARQGSVHLCSEWAYVDPCTLEVHAVADAVRVKPHHLRVRPGLSGRIGRGSALRVAGIGFAADCLSRSGPLARLGELAGRRAYVDVDPLAIWGATVKQAPFERLLIARKTQGAELRLTPLPAEQARRELVQLTLREYSGLLAHYRSHLAASGKRSSVLDDLPGFVERAVALLLCGKESFRMELPAAPGADDFERLRPSRPQPRPAVAQGA